MKATIPKSKLKGYSRYAQQRIMAALAYAHTAHKGQVRRSGQPYITHPIAVAEYLIEMGVDEEAVMGALLHDTIEDTTVTYQQLMQEFGEPVASLVEGVTKIGQIDYAPTDTIDARQAASTENVRKLLIAMSSDLRVIMIKLADRRHNLLTLEYLAPADRQRIAQESLDIFAPLADRLGMGVLKAEIEDLAFAYANPQGYNLVKRLVADHIKESETYLQRLTTIVQHVLEQADIEVVSVHGRRKHLLSIYRKLAKADGDITKIYDLMALRIIVPEVADCYQVLGLLHQHYKPLIYRIKDYIAVPKPNGYHSLHTTVFAVDGRIIEIQIRTPQMHEEAERGLAAHAIYNLHKGSKGYRAREAALKDSKLLWISELAGVTAQAEEAPELMENLKVDFFRDRIFVFSPKGDLYDLPEGATPLDFAFAIHTDVGLRTMGAKVNGRITPLDRPLGNRDVVEVLTRKVAQPSRHWVGIAKTASARAKIKAWFRAASRETNQVTGRELIEAQLPAWGYKKLEDIDSAVIKKTVESFNLKDASALFAAIGDGSVQLSTALRRLLPVSVGQPLKKPLAVVPTGRMYVLGAPELPCVAAACCNPQPPAALVGYITRGSGITVHQADCANLPDELDRLVDCGWEQTARPGSLEVGLKIQVFNRLGIVHDLTGVIAAHGTNIVKISTFDDPDDPKLALIEVILQISDAFYLSELTSKLSASRDIVSVERAGLPRTRK